MMCQFSVSKKNGRYTGFLSVNFSESGTVASDNFQLDSSRISAYEEKYCTTIKNDCSWETMFIKQ